MQLMYSDFHIMLLLRYVRNLSHFAFWNVLDFLVFQKSFKALTNLARMWVPLRSGQGLWAYLVYRKGLRRRWPHCSLQFPEGDMRRGVLRKYGKILFSSISKQASLDIILWAWLLDWCLHKASLQPGKPCLKSHLFKNSSAPYTYIRSCH